MIRSEIKQFIFLTLKNNDLIPKSLTGTSHNSNSLDFVIYFF